MNKRFETKVIHNNEVEKTDPLGSLIPPLYQSATFEFPSAEAGERSFRGEGDGYIYSRIGNPTVTLLEEKIAQLENAERGLAFSSGMGAISAVLLALTKANDHIICSKGLYGGTFELLMFMQEKYNIKITMSDFTDETEIREQIKDNTAVIFVETPINPTMQVVDLQLIANVAKEHAIPVVVDNTFLTPYLQRPIELGCDIVVHSATKYLNGHGDVIAGLAAGSEKVMGKVVKATQKTVGATLSPFDAWLLLRGIKTLPIRMDRHCDNAEKIVEQLNKHPQVNAVFYPEVNKTNEVQMKRSGGVIAFEINGDKQTAQRFLNSLSFIKVAVSLGDAETLIEHPASMTHAGIPESERMEMGITDQLIRLSIGLEAWEDIWADLEKSLQELK